MVHLGLLSLLGYLGGLTAVRYGDYAAAHMRHMPQYEDRRDAGEAGEAGDEYGDRAPDAPARLDYKYEEDHENVEDISRKEIYEDKVWDKNLKKTRKPSYNRNEHNFNVDKDRFDDEEPTIKSNRRYRIRVRNNNFETKPPERDSIHRIDDDDDNEDGKNLYRQKEEIERDDAFDDDNLLRNRVETQKKVRRKPRDRALHHLGREGGTKQLRHEEEDTVTKPRRGHARHRITQRADISDSAKHNTDYDEYYDMKRVQNIKDRLPALLRQRTVRTKEPDSTRDLENWFKHRAVAFEFSRSELETLTNATTPTTPRPTSEVTAGTQSVETSSDLSPGEKLRLSILKKAAREESDGRGRDAPWSAKPPVLLQVTRRQTAVERQAAAAEDSPQRLQRARSFMRRKLVDSARSISDLTDDWDRLICEYIDVATLDANSAPNSRLNVLLTICIFPVWLSLYSS